MGHREAGLLVVMWLCSTLARSAVRAAPSFPHGWMFTLRACAALPPRQPPHTSNQAPPWAGTIHRWPAYLHIRQALGVNAGSAAYQQPCRYSRKTDVKECARLELICGLWLAILV